MLLYETDYLTITWDEKLKCAIVKRVGFVVGEDFRYHNLKLIEIFQERKISKFISDVTEMKVISPDDQKWFDMIFFPNLYQAGLRYMAILEPKSAITKLSVGAIKKIANQAGVEVKQFSSFEQAAVWIASK